MKAQFSNTDRLENWLNNVVSSAKYDLYYETLSRRLYAIKNVSTEPRLHGYVESVDIEDVRKLADSTGIDTVTTVKSFDWEHEETPASI